MKAPKCNITGEEIESIKQNFKNDIAKCCSEHMPTYNQLKESGLIGTKEFCDLAREMTSIANKILGKIEIVIEVLKSTGRDDEVYKVMERKKFVEGMLSMIVKDSASCS